MVVFLAAELLTTAAWYTAKAVTALAWDGFCRLYYGPYISREERTRQQQLVLLNRLATLERTEKENRERIRELETTSVYQEESVYQSIEYIT